MMLEIIRDHPKPPVKGHHFFAHSQSFSGRDVDAVIEKLVAYRTQNGLPLGNPEQEIAAYYAEMAPYLVREKPDQPSETTGDRQHVAEHIMAIWYGKFERMAVHEEEVEKRLGVCAKCPHSRHDFSDPESAYWNEAATRAVMMTGQMGCVSHGWCDHHKTLIGLFARLVTPEKLATMPAPLCCWLHKS